MFWGGGNLSVGLIVGKMGHSEKYDGKYMCLVWNLSKEYVLKIRQK